MGIACTWPCLGDLGGLRLQPPAPLADHVIRPALAAPDQVLALGDLAVV
jgi:hypothetical protein